MSMPTLSIRQVPKLLPLLEERLERLEQAQLLSCSILRTLTEKLACRLGMDFLSPDLARLSAAAGDADLREFVARLDALVEQGQQPAAARLYREAMGVNWDQALNAIDIWSWYPREQKLGWLQLARWIETLQPRLAESSPTRH